MKSFAFLVVMTALLVGCPGAAGQVQDSSAPCGEIVMSDAQLVECVRHEAEAWLQLAPFEDGQGRQGLAIHSFPDGPQQLMERTYLYDQALALLWFSWLGEYETASRLATTLVALQMEDGAWGFSFEAREDGFYDQGYVRTGAVAWAGWALSYYGTWAGDVEALEAAEGARAYIESTRVEKNSTEADQFYAAGVGHHDPNTGERILGEPVEFVSTEHQFDVHKFFRAHRASAQAGLRERILEKLWIGDEGRFAMGVQAQGVDRRRALDTSGGWGALWLLSVDRPDLARKSLEYTVENFSVSGASFEGGFAPYLDAVDGYDPQQEVIFVEGSLGVALAALRLDKPQITKDVLKMSAVLAEKDDGGIPYADRSLGDFVENSAAAPTLWFLMVERELNTGRRAPLFLP